MNTSKSSGVPKSVYYYQKDNDKQKTKDAMVIKDIQGLPQKMQETYGSKQIAKELLSRNIIHNHKKLARIRKEYDIQSKIRRHKYPKDYYKILNDNKLNVPKNILDRKFEASDPMKKLVEDITYFKVKEGWLYLNAILDLYNGEIVSHSFSRNIDENLVIDTVNKLSRKHSLAGAMIHTDQGATYIGTKYCELLKSLNVTQSMSRRGNCWDNACMEQFFGTLKCDTIYLNKKQGLLSADDLIKMVDEYIYFYNNERIKKKLGWLSPVKYREKAA